MEHLQNLEIEQQILGLTIQNKIYFERIEDLYIMHQLLQI